MHAPVPIKNMIRLYLSICFLCFFMATISVSSAVAATTVSVSFTGDTTWTKDGSPYIVTGNVIFYNGTLTIEPGVIVQFNASRSLQIGTTSTSSSAKLVAQGTPEDPITFTSNGDVEWGEIYLYSSMAEGSIMEHCIIENNGYSNCPLLDVYSSNVTIKNCTFRNTPNSALRINNGVIPILEANTYTGIGGYPIYIGYALSLSAVDNTSTFDESNTKNLIYYAGGTSYSGDIYRDTSIADAGIPYYCTGGLTVAGGAVLSIAPGTEIRFAANGSLRVGNNSSSMGKLLARGSETEPITFTGNNDWYWLDLYACPAEGTILEHCIIENNGHSNYPLVNVSSSNVTIKNCTFRNTPSSGLRINSGAIPTLEANTYTGIGGYPIYLDYALSLSAVDNTSTFDESNTNNLIYCAGGTVNGSIYHDTSIADAGIPYYCTGGLTVAGGAVLSIAPGTEIQFAANGSLRVGNNSSSMGKLLARGSETEPITFTGNNDWGRLDLYASPAEGSILEHCIIENNGYSNYPLVDVYSSNVTIKNCTFRNTPNSGLRINLGAIPALEANTYTGIGGYPIYIGYAHSISAVDDTSTFDKSNTNNLIYYAGGNIYHDTSIADAGIPYYCHGSSSVYGATLTISPGAELRFEDHTGLWIGSTTTANITRLVAEGTSEAPIIFTSANKTPTPGLWYGINFLSRDSGSVLKHAVVEYGGYGSYGNVSIYSSFPVVDSCVIRHSSNYGVNITGAAGDNQPGLFCNTITGNGTGIYVRSNADPIIHDNNIAGNTSSGLTSANTSVQVDATGNYWGSAGGPGTSGADTVSGKVAYDSWLQAVSSCTIPLNASFITDRLSGCEDLTVNFIDESTGAVGSRQWDFDNNGSVDSTERNPSWTFTEPGNYTVTLTVFDKDGASDVYSLEIAVAESTPTAAFSASPQSGQPSLEVTFTDASTVCGTESITQWEWDFDSDGNIDSTEQNPSHSFNAAGYYTVTLTVMDADGNSDTKIRQDYIYVSDEEPVSVPGGPYTGTEGVQIHFDGSGSYDPNGGNISQYSWDFDNDGTPDSITPSGSVQHTYAQDGTYTVSLTVTDEAGLEGTNTTTVTVGDTDPVADFTVDVSSGIAPLTVNFTDLTNSHDGITSYIWDFGDGSGGSTVQNPAHTYTEAGTFTVTLTVSENDGDRDSKTKTGLIVIQAGTNYYLDADHDGYGTDDSRCLLAPEGNYTALQSGDCDDGNPAVHPGAEEVCGDGIDNNCNGETDEGCAVNVPGDLDGDGDVDSTDRSIFVATLRKCSGDSGYNSKADYDNDGCVTLVDYRSWLTYYRTHNN